jgi:hypothetical protein
MVCPILCPRKKSPMSRGLGIASGLLILPASCLTAFGQAIIIDSHGNAAGSIDRRYAQIEATKVELPKQPIDARGHQEILRALVAEQGFAMRPFPKGKKGLTLVANGKLSPAGDGYVTAVTEQGLSVKPGDRVVLSNIRIEKEKIIFDINGGPEHKHEFLRHIEIGMGPGTTRPVTQDPGQDPTGSRITLTFAKFVPELTGAQLKALLSPLISFDMKTPVQAYTDTLPPKLKEAILDHRVLVGMTTDMVLFAMGQPETKSRELEGQTPFEEWIYGHPPQDVSFVRVNGNRVIRVEVAKLGQPLEVFTKDEVEGLMLTNGRPVVAEASRPGVQLGDVHRDAETQAPVAPPSLRAPGETLPSDPTPGDMSAGGNREGPMKPVIFPKDTTKEPARTVPAHPKPAAPVDEDEDTITTDSGKTDPAKTDGARPAYSGPGATPASSDDQPAAKPADAPPVPAPKALLPATR